VRHSKWRALRGLWRFAGALAAFMIGYGALRRRWTAGYDALTTPQYWSEALGLEPAGPVVEKTNSEDGVRKERVHG